MKHVSLIILMIGSFFVLIAVGLNSYLIKKDHKQKINDSLAKAREAKAKKAQERKQENGEAEKLSSTEGI